LDDVDIIRDPGNVTLKWQWNRHASNPVLDVGLSGSWDDNRVFDPIVIFDGMMYRMWFSGYDGSRYRIGYATSPDGITWTKHPGNPILDLGSSGSWDDYNTHANSVIFDGATYHMWYTGQPDGTKGRIGYATSPDGISWTKYAGNLCLGTSGDGCVFDTGPVGAWDDTYVYSPSVFFDGVTYHMWYTGCEFIVYKIGYATSPDGITWTRNPSNPVLDAGPAGSFDDLKVLYPSVLYNSATSTYHMWYTGNNATNSSVGHATSMDGASWTKNVTNPIFNVGPSGSWDDAGVAWVAAHANSTSLGMWYSGYDGSTGRIGYAWFGYPYLGTLVSSVFDSGQEGTIWNSINWTEYLPPATNITVATRTGGTPNPDASWSSWSQEMWIGSGSGISSPSGRYFQYRATLTTTNTSVTPILSEVQVNFTLVMANDPPTITNIIATPNPQTAGNEVKISAKITDDVTAEEDLIVYLEITNPDGTQFGNFTVSFNQSADRFEFKSDFNIVGTYSFTFWASDEEGNWAYKTEQFDIESPEKKEYNWKPLIALIFSIILLVIGLLASYFRPIGFKGTLGRDRLLTFFLIPFPFIVAELITGIVSLFTGLLMVPPLLDVGMIVDLIIVIAGIIAIMVILAKGKNPTEYEIKDYPPPPPPLLPSSP
jgi:hypothetical protein